MNEIPEGLDGLIAIANTLDDTGNRKIPHLKKALKMANSEHREYRERVARCLKHLGATKEEQESIIESPNGGIVWNGVNKFMHGINLAWLNFASDLFVT